MLSDTIFYAPPSGQIKQAMIMFHGYGANGNDLISMAPALSQGMPDTIFYAPNAPELIAPDGYKWFDIEQGASDTVYERFDYIERLMQRAKSVLSGLMDFVRFIEYKHSLQQSDIVLMGFSQGGLLALMGGLLSAPEVKGIIASSSVPLAINNALPMGEIKSKPPVLLTHGMDDDMVPLIGMQITQNTLKNIGCKVTVHTVAGMGHDIDMSCEQAMIDFVQKLK